MHADTEGVDGHIGAIYVVCSFGWNGASGEYLVLAMVKKQAYEAHVPALYATGGSNAVWPPLACTGLRLRRIIKTLPSGPRLSCSSSWLVPGATGKD